MNRTCIIISLGHIFPNFVHAEGKGSILFGCFMVLRSNHERLSISDAAFQEEMLSPVAESSIWTANTILASTGPIAPFSFGLNIDLLPLLDLKGGLPVFGGVDGEGFDGVGFIQESGDTVDLGLDGIGFGEVVGFHGTGLGGGEAGEEGFGEAGKLGMVVGVELGFGG